MKLNAQTSRGKKALRWSRLGLRAWSKANPKYCYLQTNEKAPADLDAIIGIPDANFSRRENPDVDARYLYIGGTVDHVLEAKARDMTKEKFFGDYGGTWLVSYDKLKRCYDTAYSLRTNFYGLLVLIPDEVCYHRILAEYNEKTGGLEWVVPFKVMETETQKNINGGTAFRENAYIDMNGVAEIAI
jgi:hypothetical protein